MLPIRPLSYAAVATVTQRELGRRYSPISLDGAGEERQANKIVIMESTRHYVGIYGTPDEAVLLRSGKL